MSKIIYKGIYGSHLYGTFNENSDKDVRQIHMDSLEDIVLKRGSNVFSEHSNPNSKNSKENLDFESKELRQFIRDCLGGQTYALNILFSQKICGLNMILSGKKFKITEINSLQINLNHS